MDAPPLDWLIELTRWDGRTALVGSGMLAIAALLVRWVWGTRHPIGRFLAVSVAVHLIILAIGGQSPVVRRAFFDRLDRNTGERLVAIRLGGAAGERSAETSRAGLSDLDRPVETTETVVAFDPREALKAAALDPDAAANPPSPALEERPEPSPLIAPERDAPAALDLDPVERVTPNPPGPSLMTALPELDRPTPLDPSAIPPLARPRSDASRGDAGEPKADPTQIALDRAAREAVRRAMRPDPLELRDSSRPKVDLTERLDALETDPSNPNPLNTLDPSRLAPPPAPRPLEEVPKVFQPRFAPDRERLAREAGATERTERAVALALQWLERHQDADGRWNGGRRRDDDGRVLSGETSYTQHDSKGVTDPSESVYWEADTAMTGLALLAFMGSGHTHQSGPYRAPIAKGLAFLIREQKPDGDLRGPSQAVGLYCHAIATLALSEAHALTGDARLRPPVEKAIGFLTRSRAADGIGWRYKPGDPLGDTSVLGWVVLALKSAREGGVAVPEEAWISAERWLDRVKAGARGGLSRYQPGRPPTAAMTAEAWVCRQFLGQTAIAPEAAVEATELLLREAPGRGEYNLYAWYYTTLALFQQGGPAWIAWNDRLKVELPRRQRLDGPFAGSWDPDDTVYGRYGGRLYMTALSAMTLEVYSRYLRFQAE